MVGIKIMVMEGGGGGCGFSWIYFLEEITDYWSTFLLTRWLSLRSISISRIIFYSLALPFTFLTIKGQTDEKSDFER